MFEFIREDNFFEPGMGRLLFNGRCNLIYNDWGKEAVKRIVQRTQILNGVVKIRRKQDTDSRKFIYILNGELAPKNDYRKHELLCELSGIKMNKFKYVDRSNIIPGTLMRIDPSKPM